MSFEVPPSSPQPGGRIRGKGRFHCLDCGAAAPPAEARIVFPPLDFKLSEKVALSARELLSTPLPEVSPEQQAKLPPRAVMQAPALYKKITFTGYPPILAKLIRFGPTTLVADWLHRVTLDEDSGVRTGTLQAVSMYLTGLDADAEACAIEYCKRLRMQPGNQPLPVDAKTYEIVTKERRPVAIQAFVTPLARRDPSIRISFAGIGIAFFGSLGVGDEPGDPPRTYG